jgi:hypothetical protein
MAIIKKRKLNWKASASAQTVGYKLYWSRQGELNYSSDSEYLGKVMEVTVPDGLSSFKAATGPFDFGIVAVDDSGNESDMSTLTVPFHFIAPEAPDEITIRDLDTELTTSEKNDKILELKSRAKKAEPRTPKPEPKKPKPISALNEIDAESLEFFETDRADAAGVMFTKEDLEIFEADLKL